MNKLNPIHNQVEPPIASMKWIKIASGPYSGKPRSAVDKCGNFNSAQPLRPLRLCGLQAFSFLFTAEAQRTQRLRRENSKLGHPPAVAAARVSHIQSAVSER